MAEPLVRKSTHDLATLIAGQVASANLSEEVERYFLAQKQEVPLVLQQCFVLPGTFTLSVMPVEMAVIRLRRPTVWSGLTTWSNSPRDALG